MLTVLSLVTRRSVSALKRSAHLCLHFLFDILAYHILNISDMLANRRQKLIMDFYMGEDANGDILWKKDEILSTDLKKLAGFGKGGEKNYPGIITDLQMMLYLVTTDFRRRVNKRGEQYGMSVSVMFPPETVWGYEAVTSAYGEAPSDSYERIVVHLREIFPDADDDGVTALIGAPPNE